jgi:hypothetical protein
MKNIALSLIISTIVISCTVGNNNKDQFDKNQKITYNFTKEFNQYWNIGKADIASYVLSKGRYGEIHEGEAALVFVVEPFLPEEQVKSDGIEANEKPEKVMKLIKTKNFFTGIYPYSIMTSAFHPLNLNRKGLLKVSMSSQDWCGQVYKQLNNRETHLDLQRYSYFQKEGDSKKELEKGLLEEEIFTQIRIDPYNLPTGKLDLYPSSEYIRLSHKDFKKYSAEARLDSSFNEEGTSKYILNYLDFDRKLEIEFESAFPYKIVNWKETFTGLGGKQLTTTARLKENLHIAYWEHNSIADSTYRYLLGL